MNDETHIVGLIVHVSPEYWDEVQRKVSELPKAEAHYDREEFKFVLVFEADSESTLSVCMDKVNNWNGVLSVRLCYHHSESEKSLEEEINYATNTS